ncbi:hypothetical protein COO60DRAFT_1519840 [Scenedesmus sp. NREL 46B-D3]|nr:hypothetical protein COO60DRAFT_1519840 [Scenedesmus sp. NREL 46B-D3]
MTNISFWPLLSLTLCLPRQACPLPTPAGSRSRKSSARNQALQCAWPALIKRTHHAVTSTYCLKVLLCLFMLGATDLIRYPQR